MKISIDTLTRLEIGKKYTCDEIANYAAKGDIFNISEWLNTYTDNIIFEFALIDVSKLEKQILEMRNTYDEFPKDAKRTAKILKLLQSGKKPLPLYIEKNDPKYFVMEGRHRMVAFYEYGLTKFPVFFVSKK